MDNTIISDCSQDVLKDISITGKIKPWNVKGLSKQNLMICYDKLGYKEKAERLKQCGTVLGFVSMPEGKKLVSAQFCRVRLCPLCAWRRSIKIFVHTKKIIDKISESKDFNYIFLTLTVKNCTADDLADTIDLMMQSWNRFVGYKTIKNISKGWYRGLEVTHNLDEKSEYYDTFHPHFHSIIAVNKSYYNNKSYIKQKEWSDLWQKALKIDYTPIVDVRRVKGSGCPSDAVAEVAKYAVKDSDYIIPDDWDLTLRTVKLLDACLDKRRLVAYGGLFKTVHKQLNLDDEIDGDFIDITKDEKDEYKDQARIFYAWNVGYNQYRKVNY